MKTELSLPAAESAKEIIERARIFAALGDPNRLAVVDLLQSGDLSPDGIAAALQIPGNLLAHHLKVLEGAGVIVREHSQNDRRRIYVSFVASSMDGLLPESVEMTASRVVFVCTHNSARSVLADALWRDASEIPSTSAGTHPADQINPRAVKAAKQNGLSVAEGKPRFIDDVLLPDDVIVSVCDAVNEELAPRPNTHIHWSIPDPALIDTDAAFRDTVDELRDRVDQLVPRMRPRRYTTRRSPR